LKKNSLEMAMMSIIASLKQAGNRWTKRTNHTGR
jgi:hypothetical protein